VIGPVALVYRRYWPENVAHAMSNDLINVLATWKELTVKDYTLPAVLPGHGLAVVTDDFSNSPLEHWMAEMGMGNVESAARPKWPTGSQPILCYSDGIVGHGNYGDLMELLRTSSVERGAPIYLLQRWARASTKPAPC
jgi:hypothetical protein